MTIRHRIEFLCRKIFSDLLNFCSAALVQVIVYLFNTLYKLCLQTNADSTVCRHVISSSQYGGVMALIQYYQMETRWSIRQLLAGALQALCDLDEAVISILVTSVLPCELARDMMDHSRHVPRLRTSASLLTDIFSSGEPMPVPHFDQVGVEFILFVLGLIEDSPDEDEVISDMCVKLVLSYNLQFRSGKDNIVTEALAEQNTAKVFTEKILLLLNREGEHVLPC